MNPCSAAQNSVKSSLSFFVYMGVLRKNVWSDTLIGQYFFVKIGCQVCFFVEVCCIKRNSSAQDFAFTAKSVK